MHSSKPSHYIESNNYRPLQSFFNAHHRAKVPEQSLHTYTVHWQLQPSLVFLINVKGTPKWWKIVLRQDLPGMFCVILVCAIQSSVTFGENTGQKVNSRIQSNSPVHKIKDRTKGPVAHLVHHQELREENHLIIVTCDHIKSFSLEATLAT